jgi:hypothetical protein
MDICRTAQLALIFGRLFGQNMTLKSLTAFYRTTWTDESAFLRCSLSSF